MGVEIVGRFVGIRDGQAQFAGSLKNNCALADLKCNRLLNNIDEWITNAGLESQTANAERLESTRVPAKPLLGFDLSAGKIKTILWATGYRPDYSWLDLPLMDRKGKLIHDGGVCGGGVYALGLTFLRKRKSSFIHGAEDDARHIATHLKASLG